MRISQHVHMPNYINAVFLRKPLRCYVCTHADFKADLHNFAFLGKTARIGTASDWVWYNVPHGPQKQIESFFQGQRCIRDGKEQVEIFASSCQSVLPS